MDELVGKRYLSRPAAIVLAAAVALILALPVGARASAVFGHATRLGAAPSSQSLPLILPLKVNGAALERFATAVSTPGSPMYGDYLSIPALARRFGASASERSRVVSFLRAHGGTAVHVDATGLLAETTMSVSDAERAFGTTLSQFRAADRTRFLAPASAPRLPASLHGLVDGVVGLDTQPVASPASTDQLAARSSAADSAARASTADSASALTASTGGPVANAAQVSSSALPLSGTPSGCQAGLTGGGQTPGFSPNQYLTAYGFDPLHAAGDDGQGERVALIEIDGFNLNDLNTFAACFGLRVPPIAAHRAGVSHVLPSGEEATLDLEILSAAAPGLKAIDVYETGAGATQTLAAFAAPLQKASLTPQVISASLGLCETDAAGASGLAGIEASERLLQLAAADGVSVLASSGDNGSADCQGQDNLPIDTLAVNYPASSWWVTGVGGTNLSLTAQNTIAAEPVWNDANTFVAGGGGGYSELFTRPPYQNGVVRPNKRAVPDVSMLADLLPGYDIYCTGTAQSSPCVDANDPNPWQTVGGTSAGTPLMAGGAAIIDQILHANHRESLGLLNPLLYKLGSSSAAPGVFYDVTAGSNDIGPFILGGNGQALGCCSAAPGYDEASGWGSVAMSGLAAQALALVPKVVKVTLSIPGHQHPVAQGKLLAAVSCSAACDMGAVAKVKYGSSSFTVQSKLVHRGSQGSDTLTIKFSASQKRKLRSALTAHRRIVATLYGAQIDELGSIEHDTGGKKLVVTS